MRKGKDWLICIISEGSGQKDCLGCLVPALGAIGVVYSGSESEKPIRDVAGLPKKGN